MYRIKLAILYFGKYLGLFQLARFMTRHELRILCYHGFSLNDEHIFRPKLFMRGDLLKQRMRKIAQMKFSVISLDQAINTLRNGENLHNSLVITVDDGWQSTESVAAPIFADYKFPWTLYLTSYYAQKQTQVADVAMQYLCWKTKCKQLNLIELDATLDESFSISSARDQDLLSNRLNELHDALSDAEERQAFVRKLALILEVDQSTLEQNRNFHLVSAESALKLHQTGVDLQLHTHHHSLGDGEQIKIAAEIISNRNFIEAICHQPAVHFCYPSGIFQEKYFTNLSDLGVLSATTCLPGFNDKKSQIMALKRFLDGENISAIEFESELSGFSVLLRRMVRTLSR